MDHRQETFIAVHREFERWLDEPNTLGKIPLEQLAMEWIAEVLLLYIDQRIRIHGRGLSSISAREVARLFCNEWDELRAHLKVMLGRDAGFDSGYFYKGSKLVPVGQVFAAYVSERATGVKVSQEHWNESQLKLYELLLIHI